MKRSPLSRGKGLRPRSARSAQRDPARAELRSDLELLARCQGKAILDAALREPGPKSSALYRAWRNCQEWSPSDLHETRKRSRGGSTTEADNVQYLCRPCHEFTEAEPRLAQAVGMFRPSLH